MPNEYNSELSPSKDIVEQLRKALRDQFAMAALPAIIAHVHQHIEFSAIAEEAYYMADAMMKAREAK